MSFFVFVLTFLLRIFLPFTFLDFIFVLIFFVFFQSFEEITMYFFQCMRGIEKKIVRFLAVFDVNVFSFWIILSHSIVTVSNFASNRIFFRFYKIWDILWLLWFVGIEGPFIEVKVISSIEPGRRVGPNIPSIVKNKVIFSSSRKNILHWLCIKICVFVSTDYSIWYEALSVFEKVLRLLVPCAEVIRLIFTCPLSTNPSTNLISVDSGTFGINVNLKKFTDSEEKLFKIGSHFDYNKVLPDFPRRYLIQLRYHKILFDLEQRWEL